MAELWAVDELNPIGFINPPKSGGGLKIRSLSIQKVIIQNFSSMVEVWAIIEFNPIEFISLLKVGSDKILSPFLYQK